MLLKFAVICFWSTSHFYQPYLTESRVRHVKIWSRLREEYNRKNVYFFFPHFEIMFDETNANMELKEL